MSGLQVLGALMVLIPVSVGVGWLVREEGWAETAAILGSSLVVIAGAFVAAMGALLVVGS